MRRISYLSALLAATVVAAGVAAAAPAVNPTETVRFTQVANSGVTGSATLGANGGGTRVSVRLAGLAPGASARVLLRTGPWPRLSASFASAVTVKADANGRARASSAVRFRNEPVSWTIVADGDHVLTVVSGGRVVAYALIPGMS